MDEIVEVGRAIKAVRRGRMSLRELAARSGTSIGTLSRIENAGGNPSLGLLIRIADALGTTHLDLLSTGSGSETAVVRAAARPHARALGDRYEVELLTPDLAHDFSVSTFEIGVGERRRSDNETYSGDVCLLVLQGRLRVEFEENPRRFDLTAGDALSYEMPIRYSWRNAGARPVRVVAVFCPRGEP